ncbi:MAG: hypothetical protein ABI488_01145 [Polyangiaceae bacterium]
MSGAKYLTDEGSEATAFERELLRAGQGAGMSAHDKQAVWAGIALSCLPVAGASAAAGSAASKGAVAGAKLGLGLTPLVKGLLLVSGLGGISAGAYFVVRAPARAAEYAVVAPSVPLVAAGREALGGVSPAVAEPAIAPDSEPPLVASGVAMSSALPSASAAPGRAAVATVSATALSDESAAVLGIRAALRAGDPSGALRLLEQARLRFPHGALGQEREALTVQALAKSGNRKAASRNAVAFLRAHPTSPYASDVMAYTDD